MNAFTVYPAIDLRAGQVVRLRQGDPNRQTVYGDDPAGVARRWLDAGATWLHVVNLDGAFGDRACPARTDRRVSKHSEWEAQNQAALAAILSAVEGRAGVQFGGGLRSLADVEQALSLGVRRVILGTAAVESPEWVAEAITRFGADCVAAGIDARDGRVRVRGWLHETDVDPATLGRELARLGVRTVIFTNIARDGVGRGVDAAAAQRLAQATGLEVIAAGGVASLDDVRRARAAGLSGVIIGRALYDGQVALEEALRC